MLADNNTLTAPIAIREEKLRVLVVESYPRWEYRYLRNALSRDPGVELSCLLFHPGLSKAGGGNKDYIKQFPAGLDELSKFDVVFLGDVGVDDGQLTAEQCRLLKGLVEHQASGLVFMPGLQGRQFSLHGHRAGRPLPGRAGPGAAGRLGLAHAQPLRADRDRAAAACSPSWPTPQDDNVEVWEGLPGFQWYAPVLRAKAGSEVLCVHKDASNDSGRLPLLVTRTFGAGKVLFMGTDGAWRWRKGVEDKYHYRFWGQVVRWMAYQRNMAKGETMRLYYVARPAQAAPDAGPARQRHGHGRRAAPRRRGHGADHGPVGQVGAGPLHDPGDEWGEFTGAVHRRGAGQPQGDALLQADRGDARDHVLRAGRRGRTARPPRPARGARGDRPRHRRQGHRADKLDQVVQSLAELPDPPPSVRRIPLWCHPVRRRGARSRSSAFSG